MTKEFYNRMLLMSSLCLLSFSSPASAQCVTPPTCSELGYTKSAADCEGHTFLKCPFNQSIGYCDLGTSSTPMPEPEPTPTYKVGDAYSVNGAVIGKVISVGTTAVTVASSPRSQTNPSYEGLQTYCENLALGGAAWYVPSTEEYCNKMLDAYPELKANTWNAYLIGAKSGWCSFTGRCFCYTNKSTSYTYHYSCIAGFNINK